jgi:hypothetical protein
MMMGQSGGGGDLPSGYRYVQYIESAGQYYQYINTGFGFSPSDEVYLKCATLVSTNDKFVISPQVWNNNYNRFGMAGAYDGIYTFGFGWQGTNFDYLRPNTVPDSDMHIWYYHNRLFEVTDLGLQASVATVNFNSDTYPLYLFYGYNSETPSRIAEYWHKKNGTKVIHLMAIADNNNRGYMYDLVTKTIFDHLNGSYHFTAGPDL